MRLYLLILFLFLCSFVFGQGYIGSNGVIGQNGVLSHSGTTITGNFGGTITKTAGGDSGDGGYFQASPLNTCPIGMVPCPVNPTLNPTCHVWWGSPDASNPNWGCAIYSDNAGSPTGINNLVCGASTTTVATSGWNSIVLTGCPPTVATNTQYWVAQYTESNSQVEGTNGVNNFCPGTPGVASFQTNVSGNTPWPNSFPASSDVNNGCYTSYITLSYTSEQQYNVITENIQGCDVNTQDCPIFIPPVGSVDSLYVVANSDTTSGNVTNVKDSINGTVTDTLTKIGCATVSSAPLVQWCLYYIDRATLGVNGIDCIFTNSGGSYKTSCGLIDVQGTIATGSIDQSGFDSVYINSQSFTSASSITTEQTELIMGYDSDFGQPGVQNSTEYILAGSGWNLIFTGQGAGGSPNSYAFMMQTAGAATFNLTGSFPSGAASNSHLPGEWSSK